MTDTGEFEELAAKAARVQRALHEVRGRAASGGGEVRITVGIDGRIHEIDLASRLLDSDAARAGRMIADTHDAALRDAEAAAVAIRRELLDDPRVARVVDRVAAAPKVTEGPKATEDDDGYFARGSFLDRA